ncbi:alpha/beta hydrolase [Tateyamaria sp.]|uniref:alpha/beta hydrolase n=1 Tax=Tateyamaria sp. TaxID=1929288 RepID=UPI003B21D418
MTKIKRAIVFVPGFERREQLAVRDHLVSSIVHYTDGYKTSVSDGVTENGANRVTVEVQDRQSDYAATLDVYEAYWGDLVPDWSQESPWQRFKRGLLLIWYWAGGGLVKSIGRGEMPTRTVVAMIIAALMLLLWYTSVISVLIQAIGSTESGVPTVLQDVLNDYAWTRAILDWAGSFSDLPLILFLIGLIGLGKLEGMANISSFVKAYLRDDPTSDDDVGLRAKARLRVLNMLDHVNGEGQNYDEVHVVAHSLGGAIAVDALAEYGSTLPKTVLHTWGSAMGLLVQQEALVELEIAKLYDAQTPLNTWVDVVFAKDVMASPRPVPRKYDGPKRTKALYDAKFPDTIVPPMPKRSAFAYQQMHMAYFRCEKAMMMLVEPLEQLPHLTSPDPNH